MLKKKSHYSNAGIVFEELEPRLLLSADPLAVATEASVATVQELVLGDSEDHTAIVQSELEQALSSVRNELVIIDSRAPNYQQLHNDLIKQQQEGRNIHVVVLDAHRDGIDQINEALATHSNLNAVHIVSHGSDGQLQLGATQLNNTTLKDRKDDVRNWKDVFTDGGDLLIYGCNLAATTEGKSLVDNLSLVTETDVASSDDLTGNKLLGGDWDLEYESGDIETSVAFSDDTKQDWQGTLQGAAPAGADEQQVQAEEQQQQQEQQVQAEAEQAVIKEQEQVAKDADAEQQLNTVAAEEVRQEIVIINDTVTDYQAFIDDLKSNSDPATEFKVFLLDGESDGIEQINEILSGQEGIDAIHILSHGLDGAVKLGDTWLQENNLDDYGDSLNAWGDSLDQNADLLIYGCDLAQTEQGERFINQLAQLTGADVAASDDLTGSATQGGDWDLEYQRGTIETSVAVSQELQQNWNNLLNVTADTTSTGSSSGGDFLISHTTAGTDRLMLVGVSLNIGSGSAVTSITYNGASLSLVGTSSNGDAVVEIWSLVNPDLGTHDVDIKFNGTTDGNTAGVMTFTGVDQATPLGTYASGTGVAGSGSVTVSSVTNELVFGVISVDDPTNYDLISGGGQTEDWDLLGGGQINSGGSTKAGAASVNLGWTWAGSDNWAAGGVSIKPTNDVKLYYGDETAGMPKVREFDGGAGTWSAEETTAATGDTVKWTIAESSPTSNEELVAVLTETGAAVDLQLLRWDGSSWTTDWTDGTNTVSFADTDKRSFDLAYEQTSGHALIVYADDDTNPMYRTWDGSSWSAPTAVFSTAPGTGNVLWVELVSNPNNDQIALVYSDANNDLHSMIWDGTTWDETNTEITLTTDLSLTDSLLPGQYRTFDAAYENSGDLLVAWGTNAGPIGSATMAAGTTTWITGGTVDPITNGTSTFIDLAAEPGGDRIALAAIDENGGTARLGLAMWNGATWQDAIQADNSFDHINALDYGSFFAGVGWVGTTGEAVAIYSDADAGKVNWVSWTGTGWTVQTDVDIPGSTTNLMRSVQIKSFEGQDKLMAVFSDDQNDLYAATYDGTTWTVTNTGSALETSLSDAQTVNFDFVVNAVNAANPVATDDSYSVAQDTTLNALSDWWDTNWQYREQITFTNAPATTLTDFPLLIELTDGVNIDYTKTQNNGEDLRFIDADGTFLDYEIEEWNESGTSYVWVQVPQIDTSGTDYMWMYYGNGSASDSQNATGVWDANYAGVWHLNQEVGGLHEDSTANNNDGVETGNVVEGSGQIGGGQVFDPDPDGDGNAVTTDGSFINVGSDATLDDLGAFTISAWVNWGGGPNQPGQAPVIVTKDVDGSAGRLLLEIDNTAPEINTIEFIKDYDTNDQVRTSAQDAISTDPAVWQQVVVTSDGSDAGTGVRIYIDGIETIYQGAQDGSATRISDALLDLTFGATSTGVDPFEGSLDEIRISNMERSADWIQASYDNQNAPGAFVTFGAEQTAGEAGVLLNDTDADGDPLSVTAVQGGTGNVGVATATDQGGSVTLQADGSFSYTPLAGFTGSDTFTYTVSDGNGGTDTATVTITVTAPDTVSVTQSGGSTDITEGGVTDTLDVVLTSQPSADVTVTLTPDAEVDLGSGVGVAHVLTFTTANWDTVQVVTVTANDDAVVEGAHTSTITITMASADPAYNMVSDTFTEGSDIVITAHTSDTGEAWTTFFDSTVGEYEEAYVDATLDVLVGGAFVGTLNNNTGQAYAVGTAPASADQTLSFTLSAIETDSGTKPVGLFGRATDINNFYFLQVLPNANGQDSIQLSKMVGGVETILASVDATIAAGDTFMLEITDSAKKVYHNGAEVLSHTDNTLTAAGDRGFFIGNFSGIGGHYRPTWQIDDFQAQSGPGAIVANITDNDSTPPTATNLSAPETYTEDTVLNLTDIVVSDVDSPNVTVTLTLSDVGAGTLSTGTSNAVTSTFVGGVWTASGAIADVNTLLAGVTFTPTLNYNSNFTIATSVDDGVAAAITGTKVMTGTNVDDPAVIGGAISYVGNEGDAVGGTMTATDVDGLTDGTYFTVTGAATNGTASINAATGAWTFVPTDPNWFGSDSFTVTVTDDLGGTTMQVVNITLANVNDAPVANDNSYSVTEDQTLVINALNSNTTSTDLTAAWQFEEGSGTTTTDATGNGNDGTLLNGTSWTTSSRTGDAALSFDGVDDYVQTTSSTLDLSTATSFTLSAWFQTNTTAGEQHIFWQGVSAENGWGSAPGTNAEAEMHLSVGRYDVSDKITFFLGYLDTPSSIDITSASNFTDTSGWHHVVVVVSDLGGGTLQADLYVDGVLEGSDTGTETDRSLWDTDLRIGQGGPAGRNFNGSIDEVGIYNRDLTAAEVSALYATGVIANDTDVEGGTLTASLVAGPANGTVSLNTDGSFTYTPNAGYVGPDSFTYKVNDGAVDSNTATVNINVTPVNDAPTATNLSAGETYTEDTALNLTDIVVSDVDSPNVTATLTLSDVGAGTLSTGTSNAVTSTFVGGVWTASGAIADVNTLLAGVIFTPTLNYNSNFNIFTSVDDGIAPAITGTKVMTGTPVDDAAVIGGVISYVGNEGDAVGGTMTATDVDGLTDGTYFSVTTAATNGTAAINASTGAWTFVPTDPNWFGSDSFTVTVTDDLGGTTTQVVNITLSNVDDPATIGGQVSYVGNEGDAVGGTMTATDVEGLTDGTYFTVTGAATNGTASINASTGAWTFTPTDPNWFGSDSFTVTVTDDLGGTTTQVVNITLSNVDDPATIGGAISYVGSEGDAVGGTMTAIDVDGLTDGTYFSVTTAATNGTASINAATGAWTFVPTDPNWFGSDSFTVTVTDDLGGTTTQVVNITLSNVDDPATIGGAISYVGNEGDAVGGTMTATDVDGLTDGTYFSVTTAATNGTAAINASTGAWTFVPTDPNWFGSDSFTVTVTDDLGGTTTQVVNITLSNVDDPATIGGQVSYVGNEGDAVGGTMTATDVEGLTDGTYFTVTGAATNGTASINATTGAWTFTPTDPNWFGSDSFTVTVTDDLGGTTTQVVNITLSNVDDPAVIGGAISYVGNEGDAVGGTMTATDVDGLTDGTYFTVTGAATNGTASINASTGAWTFVPTDPNWFGSDSFTVTVTDDLGGTTTQVVNITLANVNDPAIIGGLDTGGVTEDVDPDLDTLLETSGALTITDVDPGEASFTAGVYGGVYGVITLNAAGNWDYAANTNQAAIQSLAAGATIIDTITIQSVDGTTHDITITITGTNDAPVAGNDVANVNEGGSVNIDVAATDSDIDDALDLNSIVITGAPTNGSIVVNANGTVDYTHDGSETLVDSFTYTISDISGAISNTATVTVTINPVNDPPAATDDAGIVNEGGSVIIDLAANDTDVDNALDLTSINIISAPANATLVDNLDGTFTYNHDGSNTTSDSFTYTISDISGAISNTATVNVTIVPVNDVPTTSGIADVTVSEDASDTSIDLNPSFNDLDNLDSELTYTVAGNTNIGLFTGTNVNGAGQLTLDYAANANGSAQISMRATDPSGAFVDTLFTVTVNAVNDTPVMQSNTGAVATGTAPTTISASQLSVSDVDNLNTEVIYTVTAIPTNGALLLNGVAMGVNGVFTQADLDNNLLSYQSSGSGPVDQFSFTVADTSGAALGNNTFDITVQLTPADDDEEEETTGFIPLPNEPDEIPEDTFDPFEDRGPVSPPGTFGDGFTPFGGSSTPPPQAPPRAPNTPPSTQPVAEPVEEEIAEVVNNVEKEVATFAEVQVRSMDALWGAIDKMKQEMADAANDKASQVAFRTAMIESSGLVLTAGVVAWILRSGALLSSLLSTIPLWKGYDPLPILAYKDDDDKKEEEEDDIHEDKIPTSLEELRKVKKLKEQKTKKEQVDDLFGGSST